MNTASSHTPNGHIKIHLEKRLDTTRRVCKVKIRPSLDTAIDVVMTAVEGAGFYERVGHLLPSLCG